MRWHRRNTVFGIHTRGFDFYKWSTGTYLFHTTLQRHLGTIIDVVRYLNHEIPWYGSCLWSFKTGNQVQSPYPGRLPLFGEIQRKRIASQRQVTRKQLVDDTGSGTPVVYPSDDRDVVSLTRRSHVCPCLHPADWHCTSHVSFSPVSETPSHLTVESKTHP